jgi:hypothetical protein
MNDAGVDTHGNLEDAPDGVPYVLPPHELLPLVAAEIDHVCAALDVLLADAARNGRPIMPSELAPLVARLRNAVPRWDNL